MLPPIAPERARMLAGGMTRTHVLVVGDAMLDKFIAGRVTRLSPEAPVPVVMFDHESHRIGGAANVAHNVIALGGQAALVSCSRSCAAARSLPTSPMIEGRPPSAAMLCATLAAPPSRTCSD